MITCTVCGSFKVENKELKLCATHNRERIKAEVPAKEKKVYVLKKTPVAKVSTKKASALRAKEKTQKEMREAGIRWCETCGTTDRPLSHSHIISVGQHPEFEADPRNQIYECFGSYDSCHYIWEHGSMEDRMQQSTFDRKIRVIRELRPDYLEKLILNGTRNGDYETIRGMVLKDQ